MLKTKQKKCLEMLIKGDMKQSEIARQLKITPQTISNWKKDEEFADELKKGLKLSIQSLAPKAIKTMGDLLESDSDNVRYSAAKDILDRTGFKPDDNTPKVDTTENKKQHNELLNAIKESFKNDDS